MTNSILSEYVVPTTKSDVVNIVKLFKSVYEDNLSQDILGSLEEGSFFTDPASIQYHGAHTHGLMIHSALVGLLAQSIVLDFNIPSDERLALSSEALVAGLLHDICKVGTYSVASRWRKDKNNKWESYRGYLFKEDDYPMGHGEKSLLLLARDVSLSKISLDIQLAIRWHMGVPTDFIEAKSFSKAMQMSKVALAVTTADMLASYGYETQGSQETLIW